MTIYNVEVTDTFAGEANYCWVKRFTIESDVEYGPQLQRDLVRKAKAAAQWTGRTVTDSYGYSDLTVRPRSRGVCQIMFINYADPQPGEE